MRYEGLCNPTLIVADGFSCRQQIEQATNRKALHVAEVLHRAMQGKEECSHGAFAETGYLERHGLSTEPRRRATWLVFGVIVVALLGVRWWRRQRHLAVRREDYYGFPAVP